MLWRSIYVISTVNIVLARKLICFTAVFYSQCWLTILIVVIICNLCNKVSFSFFYVSKTFVNQSCVPFPAVTACDGENHEGVLVCKWSSQTDGLAHQKDPLSAQRGGGRQDVSGPALTSRKHSHRKQTLKTANENPASFKATLQVMTRPTSPF